MMKENQSTIGREKGKKLITAIVEKKIVVERRPNHGKDFHIGYEKLHKKIFFDYLGSCSRFVVNKRIKERPYNG